MANKMSVDSLAWIPATSTQARYNIPGELMYGNGKAAWLPVTVSQLESDGINALFTLEWDNSIKIKAKIKDCLARHDDQIQDDLTLLQMPNEASILYNLGNRFRDGHNVTSFGRYFISVNPCHSLIRKNGMYQNSVSNMHALFSSEPSVNMFSIAVKSRNTIVDRLLNQTVIMRGCSGSGKTESTKEILQYLLYCDNPRRDGPSNQSDNYQALGHAQNPLIINNSCNISKAVSSIVSIFDYFGSASTDKNLNSSRLLKCIRLLYKIGMIRLCMSTSICTIYM
jgi:myosin heavy subunit